MNAVRALCIAGTHSGVGKTTLTLGVLAALRQRGCCVQPFKCGPDYIDPGHHTQAAGRVSRNLDTWMMGEAGVARTFQQGCAGADVAVVEGVMGLFDGASSVDDEGSTAHVCRLLDVPVVLVVNAKAMARSVAALVHGFSRFDPRVRVVGVIANRVGSDRHAAILRESLEAAGLPPLLGAVPTQPDWELEARHLGLVTAAEGGGREAWFDALGKGVEACVDIDKLLAVSGGGVDVACAAAPPDPVPLADVRLGVARDEAFQFYYEETFDLLRAAGVELVPFSPMGDATLPDGLDGLYLGGGYPELHAAVLAENRTMRDAIRAFAQTGAPVYGECGGFMYLCRSLVDGEGARHEMCGVFEADAQMQGRLRRLGYVEVQPLSAGWFGPESTVLRGHEFHWSDTVEGATSSDALFKATYKRGGASAPLGMRRGGVAASYVHLHFGSCPAAVTAWAAAMRGGRDARGRRS